MDNVLLIQPAMRRVVHGNVSLPVADIELGGVPRGAVLILCEPGELEATSKDVGTRFAEHGYESTTADLDAVLGHTDGDDAVIDAVRAILEHVARRDWATEQTGVVGYGSAGRAAMLAAISFPLGAAVSAAPRLDDVVAGATDQPVAVSTPWLAMFAADEGHPDAGRIANFRAAIEGASSAFTSVVAYPRVSGTFYHRSREPVEYAAEFDSWQRTLEWLNLRVVPRLTPLAHAWRARHTAA